MKLQLDNHTIDINVLYSVRKKLYLQMDAMGRITVKAPNGTSDEVIQQAVKQHEQEIVKRLQAIAKAQQAAPKVREYEDEGKFLHLGKYYPLQELIETEGLSEEELRLNLRKFYFASCKKVVAERIKPYQEKLKVKPKQIDIVESATKWGSCSSSKKLTFNYRLAMAPVEVIDYVIIHELCHLTHMNHDRSFWRLIGSIMPDYKEKEAYLARYGQAMTL
ncbi:M48 family metallopeptidase [Paenibacillus glycanilyticus]|uniref:Zinc metalloprotease n=1 Tax=Paenibacillus glycanilyticus TaxID=126569 RepID=A0ABQ6G6U5_9BACL|nr:SprT family zinc-dependent metalloprotease [Paenibacillus glycanilyticus]GLX65725.1 zinc metalloprotease [Paenibacillus glycanilyticus]